MSNMLAVHSQQPLAAWEVWLVRHKRGFLLAGALVIGLALTSVGWQLAYPADRALPLMQVGGVDVAGKDRAAITTQLADYAQKGEVTISSPSRQWKAKWQSVGVTIDPAASADAVLTYEGWERLLPFSSLIRAQQARQLPLVAIVDDDRLTAFAQQLVADDKQAAHDANIHIKDGQVVVEPEKNGYVFTVEDVKAQVQAAVVNASATLHLVPQTIPARPASDLAAAKAVAQDMLAHHLTLKVGTKTYTPSASDVGAWLAFVPNDKTQKLQVQVNHDAVQQYLMQLDHLAGIEPGTSTVTTVDGIEIARTPATSGQTVATDANIQGIEQALKSATATSTLTMTVVASPPRVSYVHTYSQSDAGLLAIVNDWRAAHAGDYAVIVRELGGKNRYAEVNPDKPYVTASTFKLFVYYAVEQHIQAGDISYQTKTDMGWTVDACLQEMIVHSTNPCAISLLNLVGWQAAEDMAHAAGFTSTFLNNRDGTTDKHSTIRDEVNYMTRLYYGTLLGKEATDRLVGYLLRQVWRGGLPSGVPAGTPVADKVGLYDGWVHDVGIIYGPKSTFIVGIMSRGGSDPAFADLAGRMYDFFRN